MALPSLHMQELPKVDPTMKLFFLCGAFVSITIVGRLFLTTCYLELTGLHNTSSQGCLSHELRIPHSLAITLWGIQKYGCLFTIAILMLMLRAIFGVFKSTYEFRKFLRIWQEMGNPRAEIAKELGMNLGIQVMFWVTTLILGGRHYEHQPRHEH
jgi:prepilin signal peptidase PulO-like enzyme (type II secretory pathway)